MMIYITLRSPSLLREQCAGQRGQAHHSRFGQAGGRPRLCSLGPTPAHVQDKAITAGSVRVPVLVLGGAPGQAPVGAEPGALTGEGLRRLAEGHCFHLLGPRPLQGRPSNPLPGLRPSTP